MPKDLVVKILSYLPINDQISAQKVCKQWNNLLKSQNTRRFFYLDVPWEDHDVPIALLSKCREFRELESRIKWTQIFDTTKSISGSTTLNAIINFCVEKIISYKNSLAVVGLEELTTSNEYEKRDWFIEHGDLYGYVPDTIESLEEKRTIWGEYIPRFSQIIVLSMSVGYIAKWILNSYESAKQKSQEELVKALRLPQNLTQDPFLGQYVCPISGRVPLLPVVDKCNHLFDYLYIGDHIAKKIECPITHQCLAQDDIKFDLKTFINIQKRLAALKRNNAPLVQGLRFKIFNFPEQLP